MGEIKEALGLGTIITLKSGAKVNLVPSSWGEVEDAQGHWEIAQSTNYVPSALFSPKNKDIPEVRRARESLEWLVIKASGSDVPSNEKDRQMLAKEKLKPFNVGDSQELFDYIARFLGYNIASPASSETAEAEQPEQVE